MQNNICIWTGIDADIEDYTKRMPGMYQKVSGGQRAPPASWHTRGSLEEAWHGLFQCLWWQLICINLWLFLKVSLSLHSQNIILVIKGPSNWSLFDWRVSRQDSLRQWTTVSEQGVCQVSLWLRHQDTPPHHQGIPTLMVSLSDTYRWLKICFQRVLILGPFRKS